MKRLKSAVVRAIAAADLDLLFRNWVNFKSGDVLRILSLHRVIDSSNLKSPEDERDLARGCLSLKEFQAGLRHLKLHYSVVSLPQCLDCLEQRRPLPRNAVVLTFDDAFEDVFTIALPALIDTNLPFTVFLTSGWIGRQPQMLSCEQIREIANRAGKLVTWGAHGVTHRQLTAMSVDEAEAEIARSRAEVAQLTNSAVDLFCYPDGKHNETIKGILQRQGFKGACATGRILNRAPIDPFALTRIPFDSEPLARFVLRVAGYT